ncbi:DUF3060 domain-containing protein [Mycobacterium sp. SMC-4]|uniref:DUF3060 domain-containing protein n=1 Tax=Mycobacterium sp. SMC-4 TaxID=2857059 RepID=UPI003D086BCA
MEPDADPEARIRDLERPLAERAHVSELGYSPYHAPPQRVVHKNSRAAAAWLIPSVVGVVVVTAAIAAIVFFTSRTAGFPTPAPPPGIAGGGGSVLESGEQVVVVGPGAVTSLGGVQTRRTVQCDGGTVSVSGVGNVIDVLGPCTAVVVSGVENVLTVDTAQSINASGFDNRVTYRSGTPEVSTSGSGNVVEPG